jgi:hypothetical protein
VVCYILDGYDAKFLKRLVVEELLPDTWLILLTPALGGGLHETFFEQMEILGPGDDHKRYGSVNQKGRWILWPCRTQEPEQQIAAVLLRGPANILTQRFCNEW